MEIAVSIFTKHPPKEAPGERVKCPGRNCKETISEYDTICRSCGSNFPACVVSGKSITSRNYYRCKGCKHKMYESEVEKFELKYCALCHTPIDFRKFGQRND
jgi:WD repeat-containing protein 35